MGEELVSGSILPQEGRVADETQPSFLYTDYLKSYLPFYLSIGMTYDQYWNDDVDLCIYYKKAFELQQQRRNEEMWLQGMYIYEAICDVSPVLRAFSKATKPIEYAKEPYPLTQKEIDYRKQRDEKLRFQKMLSKMEDLVGRDIKKEVDENGCKDS